MKPAALRCCSTLWPTATASTAKAATAARTRFGCFQVRSAIRFMWSPDGVGDGTEELSRNLPDFKVITLKFKLTLLTSLPSTLPPRIRPVVQPRLRPRPHRRALVAADRPRALARPAALLGPGPQRRRRADRHPHQAPARPRGARHRRPPRARPAGVRRRLRADRGRPRPGAADARAGALGDALRAGRRRRPPGPDLAGQRLPRHPAAARRRATDGRPAQRRPGLLPADRGRLDRGLAWRGGRPRRS